MSDIKATCPKCGDVELSPESVRLFICRNVRERSHYVFVCPDCRRLVNMPADDEIIGKLQAVVRVKFWRIPLEALEEHTGPRFTPDDELDFGLTLEGTDDVFAVFLSETADC